MDHRAQCRAGKRFNVRRMQRVETRSDALGKRDPLKPSGFLVFYSVAPVRQLFFHVNDTRRDAYDFRPERTV